MIKKILMVMALLLSLTGTTLAKDVQFTELYAHSKDNTVYISTGAIFENFEPNPKDWIGIYKVGDSNSWANVKLWTWAKNFKDVEDGYGNQEYTFKNANLAAGRYEARYFLNNTFTTRLKSESFMVATDKLYAYYASKNNSLYIEIRNKNFKPNPKDWIGIYSKYDSNAWKNVRQWTWAKNLTKNPGGFYDYQFKKPSLSSGTYEARYFLNNTFVTDKQSKPFKVQVDTDNKLYGHHSIVNKQTYIEVQDKNFKPNPKDWLGVYAVGDSNDWDNVKLWIWAKDLEKGPGGYYHKFKNDDPLWGQTFEVRYFLNNTFTTDKTSKPFTAKDF